MKRRWKKGFFLALLTIMVFICQAVVGSAREIDQMPDLEPGKTGSLSVSLSYKNEAGESIPIEGVTLQVFLIAKLTVENGGSSTYTLTSDFAKTGIVFDGMSASSSNQAAKECKAIVLERELTGQAAVTDAEGMVYFENLEPGMYLVMQTANADSVPLYTEMDPYLVSVPTGQNISGETSWKYQVDTIPKTEVGRKPALGSIVVKKRLTLQQDNDLILLNVEDATFYVGLFKDEEGTKPYSEDYVKPIRIQNGSSGQIKYTDLPEGIYYVFETDESGVAIKNGQEVDNGFTSYTCTVEGSGEQKVTLDPAAGKLTGTVEFNNVFGDLPRNYYIDAEVQIKKSVYKGSDKVNVDDTFYVGLFTKEGDEYILNQVVELKQNDTVKVPIVLSGNDEKSAVEYWIFETDKNGKRVDKETFPYEVSGEGAVTLSPSQISQTVKIINRIKNTDETEPTTPGDKETEKKTTVTVETGDTNPIVMYIVVGLAGLLVLLILAGIRYKTQKDKRCLR